ncbi:MAG: hypothetical protein ACRCT1_09135 [Microcoleaceae cyanobacterium]
MRREKEEGRRKKEEGRRKDDKFFGKFNYSLFPQHPIVGTRQCRVPTCLKEEERKLVFLPKIFLSANR